MAKKPPGAERAMVMTGQTRSTESPAAPVDEVPTTSSPGDVTSPQVTGHLWHVQG